MYCASDLPNRPEVKINHVWDRLIPEKGATFIVAPPKFGKTVFVTQLARKIAMGEPLFGRDTCKCAVLYLDLESDESMFRFRYKKLHFLDDKTEKNLYVHHECNVNMDDNQDNLINWLTKIKKYFLEKLGVELKVIIIDTFQKVRDALKCNYGNAGGSVYRSESREVDLLSTYAKKEGISIILLHHTNKGSIAFTDDPMNTINGSNGISGSADSFIIFYKKGKKFYMYAKGRTVDAQTFDMFYNADGYGWDSNGEIDVDTENDYAVCDKICSFVSENIQNRCDPTKPFKISPSNMAAELHEYFPDDTDIHELNYQSLGSKFSNSDFIKRFNTNGLHFKKETQASSNRAIYCFDTKPI